MCIVSTLTTYILSQKLCYDDLKPRFEFGIWDYWSRKTRRRNDALYSRPWHI